MGNIITEKNEIWPFDDIQIKAIIGSLVGEKKIIANEQFSNFLSILSFESIKDTFDTQNLYKTINGRTELLIRVTSQKEIIKNNISANEILIFRYPFDILPYFQLLISKHWDKIIDNLINRWKLINKVKDVYISESAFVDESITFKGAAIIGPNSTLKNNVIIGDKVIVDKGCLIENYSKISKLSYIGKNSEIGHCAEISGIIMSKAFIVHSCYFRGVMGDNCNLGAGTRTGTDRFDKRYTEWIINGEKVPVTAGANDVYLGSNSRTGVNVTLCSGSVIGKNCIIGPGTVFKGVLNDYQKVFTLYKNIEKHI